MRTFFTFFLLLICFELSSQSPMTIVVRNPAWLTSDEAKEALEKADRLRQLEKLTEQVNTQKESLQTIKDATDKLRKINRKVANYHNLELAIAQVSDSYARVLSLSLIH